MYVIDFVWIYNLVVAYLYRLKLVAAVNVAVFRLYVCTVATPLLYICQHCYSKNIFIQ